MHNYSYKVLGKYLKDNYSDLDKISRCDLEDMYMIAKTYNLLLDGDKNYHIIDAMEKGDNKNTMDYEELIMRFSEMYSNADPNTKSMIKAEINRVTM